MQIDDERLLEEIRLALCFYGKEENEKGETRWKMRQLAVLESSRHHEETVLFYPAEELPERFDIRKQYGVILSLSGNAFFYGSVWIGDEIPVEALLAAYRERIGSPDADGKDEENHAPGTEHAGEDARGRRRFPGSPIWNRGRPTAGGVVGREQTKDRAFWRSGRPRARDVREERQRMTRNSGGSTDG